MKNFIKTILAASFIFTAINVSAVSQQTITKLEKEREKAESLEQNFQYFDQLPNELQTLIIAAINDSSTPTEAARRLTQLRSVNTLLKKIVESPISGKILMQKISDRFPTMKMDLLIAAFKLANPGSLAWLKEQFHAMPEDTKQRVQFNFALAKAIKSGKLNAAQIIELVGDPNYIIEPWTNRTLIFTAAQADTEENKRRLLTDLIDTGADVNKTAIHTGRFGEITETVLDAGGLSEELQNFLRSKGAKTAVELEPGK